MLISGIYKLRSCFKFIPRQIGRNIPACNDNIISNKFKTASKIAGWKL